MSLTFGKEEHQTSYTSLTVVTVLHLALALALVYGLKTASVMLPHEQPVDITTIPPDQPPPLPEVKVKVDLPTFVQHELPPPPSVNPSAIENPPQPPHPPGAGGGDGPVGIQPAPPLVAADVFVGAVVDARSCDKPDYPASALRNGDEGIVTLELLVGTDGKVAESKVLKSSGHRELDKAAVAGLSLCKFIPAKLNGQPQKSWAKMQYAWTVQNQ